MKYELKDYQRDAVDELKDDFNLAFERKGKVIVFKSPTGSGKTFMASSLFEELTEENPDLDFCVVWCSIGKGQLQKQSFLNVKEYLQGNPVCTLLEDDFFGSRSFIKKHEIVFVNWEKLVDQDKETGEWINNLMKDQEGRSFIDVIDNTKKRGTKIILVVDESHIGAKGGTRISEFKEKVIIPDVTLEMSATPIITNQDFTVVVDPQKVIDEGMMKEQIVVNKGIKEIQDDEFDSETLILQKAYEMRERLKKEYEKIGSRVNPLVLIQIPNVQAGDEKKIVIKDFLREKGVTQENGKLVSWCDDSDDFDRVRIRDIDNKIEFLIFKTAIATGWDCPRAQILIKFREGKSEIFEIQTVGRILRTAEAKSYGDELLDTGYVFSNIKGIETKKETYSPNIIKTLWSYFRTDDKKRPVYSKIHLRSFYRSRKEDYNAANAKFSDYFVKAFMDFFELQESDKYSIPNMTLFDIKGLVIPKFGEDEIVSEKAIDSVQIDKEKTYQTDTAKVRIAGSDLEKAYYSLISEHLNGLAYIRSKPSVNVAIFDAFSMFLGSIFKRDEKVIGVQKTVISNVGIFSKILDTATLAFRHDLESNKGLKGTTYDFEISPKKAFSSVTHEDYHSKLSLYQPLYVLLQDINNKPNKLETDFMDFLSMQDGAVDWFWQNGPEVMRTNFGISYNNGLSTFQPDWIVRYKDGTIGIYDTKPIDHNVEDTKVKAEALFAYLESINQNRSKYYGKVIGGIVVQSGSTFFVTNEPVYYDYKASPRHYELFENTIDRITQSFEIMRRNQEVLDEIKKYTQYNEADDEDK